MLGHQNVNVGLGGAPAPGLPVCSLPPVFPASRHLPSPKLLIVLLGLTLGQDEWGSCSPAFSPGPFCPRRGPGLLPSIPLLPCSTFFFLIYLFCYGGGDYQMNKITFNVVFIRCYKLVSFYH